MPRLAIPILGLVLLIATGWWFWNRSTHPLAASSATTPTVPASTPPLERYPLAPENTAATTTLPALDESDAALGQSLVSLAGTPIDQFLNTPRVLRKFVATVDNLPRARIAVELRPLRATPSEFKVSGDDRAAVLDVSNASRYEPLMALARHIDTAAATAVYRHYYPLLQSAYQDLGYPNGHFNDRMVEVIDLLLTTPESEGPLKLVRGKVFWEYADPELEQLAAGQKLLLRMGLANERYLKKRLRELRAELVK